MVRATSISPSRDSNLVAITALVFSLGMGVQSILLPLLALAAGYSKADVGILTAMSAITQLVARLSSPAAMRYLTDRALVAVSGVALALSGFLVALSSFVVVFIIAELVQGIARGLFWSASVTHIVRQEGSSAGRMARVNFISSFGLLAGPMVAGYIARFSLPTALLVSGTIALFVVVPSMMLKKELPFIREGSRVKREIWSQSEVRLGSWAGVTAGSWRGILNSYIPVVLRSAGESYVLVGVLVSIANGASILGAGLMGMLHRKSSTKIFALGVAGAAVGTGLIGFSARSIVISGLLLAAGGVGAGLLQTLGPVIAAAGVSQSQKGDAIALAGSFRAAALFGAPLLMAALLGPLGLTEALLISGGILGSPILAAKSVLQRSR